MLLKDVDPWADSMNLKSSSKMIFATSYTVSKKLRKLKVTNYINLVKNTKIIQSFEYFFILKYIELKFWILI